METFDLVVRGGSVAGGLSSPLVLADVAIQDDKIAPRWWR